MTTAKCLVTNKQFNSEEACSVANLVKIGENFTLELSVWKFQNDSVTQILGEL